jgi:hypothetical protein
MLTSCLRLTSVRLVSRSKVTRSALYYARRGVAQISDPSPDGRSSPSILLKHPLDPTTHYSSQPTPSSSSSSSSPSLVVETQPETTLAQVSPSTLDAVPKTGEITPYASGLAPSDSSTTVPTYENPPFHTHSFVKELEKTFPTTTARHLMRATRALLVDRISRVNREGLTVRDLENVCGSLCR